MHNIFNVPGVKVYYVSWFHSHNVMKGFIIDQLGDRRIKNLTSIYKLDNLTSG